MRVALIAAWLGAVGCDGTAATAGGAAAGTGSAPSTGLAGGGDGSTTAVTGDGTPRFDVAGGDGEGVGDGGGDPGCAKVDFLFVIDGSGSMQDEQAQLIASFGPFMTTIQQVLDTDDVQVMVVDTDAAGGFDAPMTCEADHCTCMPMPGCCLGVCQHGFAEACSGEPCQALFPDDCDATLGAGRIFRTAGARCLAQDGPRFLRSSPALADEFACVGDVGVVGSGDEQPMAAMLAAIGSELGEPGACNAGFVRDDAILVITVITDEDDVVSAGTPAAWADAVLATKGGDTDAIVVLGLFGDTGEATALCEPLAPDGVVGADDGVRLRAFVEGFAGRGITGSVCAPDYAGFFADAVAIIDETCAAFVPAG